MVPTIRRWMVLMAFAVAVCFTAASPAQATFQADFTADVVGPNAFTRVVQDNLVGIFADVPDTDPNFGTITTASFTVGSAALPAVFTVSGVTSTTNSPAGAGALAVITFTSNVSLAPGVTGSHTLFIRFTDGGSVPGVPGSPDGFNFPAGTPLLLTSSLSGTGTTTTGTAATVTGTSFGDAGNIDFGTGKSIGPQGPLTSTITGSSVAFDGDTSFNPAFARVGDYSLTGTIQITLVPGQTAQITATITAQGPQGGVVPEPSSFALAAIGLGAMGLFGYRRRRRNQQ